MPGSNAKEADVIYFVDGYAFQDVYILLNKFFHGKPLIYGNHAPLYTDNALHNLYVRLVNLRTLRFFDAIHVLNSEIREVVGKHFHKDIFLIPNGTDIHKYHVRDNLEKAEKFRILFVGGLSHQKGADILPDILSRLNGRHRLEDKITLTICGDGYLVDDVQNMARANANVRYLGYRSDTAPIYRDNDLLLAPSRWETMMLTALEAQASGLPVVSSRIHGLNDIILNEEQGLLVEKGNVGRYVDAVLHYYNTWAEDCKRYKEIVFKCRKNAVERFDWDDIVERLAAMLERVAFANQP